MEDEKEREVRTVQEIKERVLGLIAAIGKVHFPKENQEWIGKQNIQPYLTPAELDFINTNEPTHQALINFSWKAESMVSLIWSLHGLETMPKLDEQFDMYSNALIDEAINDTQTFLSRSTLRDKDELSRMESFLYHQHWRVRDRDLGFNNDQPNENDPDIDTLDSGIVYERRYGMTWIVGFGESWDDVPTDT